jgi:hypothetical protein
MKSFIYLTALVLAAASVLAGAETPAHVKDEVLKAEEDWKAAVLKADRGALEKLIGADLSYTHSSGKTQTKEEFIQDATGGALHYKAIEFENTQMRQYGSAAVVVTHAATIKSVETGTSHLYLTEVWAKQGGQWQMVSRQATKIP